MTPLRRVKAVEAKANYRLAITWDRGNGIVDLSDMIKKGGVFEPLSDQSKFRAVRITENNRGVEWPFPADEWGYPVISIDADALFEKMVSASIVKKAEVFDQIVRAAKEDANIPNLQRS